MNNLALLISTMVFASCTIEVSKHLEGTLEEEFGTVDLNSPCPDTILNSLSDQASIISSLKIARLEKYQVDNGDSILLVRWFYHLGKPLTEERYEKAKLQYYFVYDTNDMGRTKRRTTYNHDSSRVDDLVYRYDQAGNRTESYQELISGEIVSRQSRTYDSLNRNVELYYFDGDSKYLAMTFEHCPNGSTRRSKHFDQKGTIQYESKYNLDKYGNLEQTIKEYPDGTTEIGGITRYGYDSMGRIDLKEIPKKVKMNIEGKELIVDLSTKTAYSYYSNGLLKKEISYKTDSINEIIVYRYKK